MYMLTIIFLLFLYLIGEIKFDKKTSVLIFIIVSFIYLGEINEKCDDEKFVFLQVDKDKEKFDSSDFNDEILDKVNKQKRKKEDELSLDLRK